MAGVNRSSSSSSSWKTSIRRTKQETEIGVMWQVHLATRMDSFGDFKLRDLIRYMHLESYQKHHNCSYAPGNLPCSIIVSQDVPVPNDRQPWLCSRHLLNQAPVSGLPVPAGGVV
jgi:hypothetical protein